MTHRMSHAATLPLATLLRGVSRSFYLTLRLLPREVRTQVEVAYLLARATDTIADTEVVPMEERLDALDGLRDRILGCREEAVTFHRLAEEQALPAERALLERMEEVIGLLQTFPCFDRCCVREVLSTIVSGQRLDLVRFGRARSNAVVALSTEEELDDYTFRVAGCVGGFWTRLCRSHLYPGEALDLQRYLDDAVRFGKGLQLVNILRDVPADLRQGRCYLPQDQLADHGLTPKDLGRPEVGLQLAPVYRHHLERAADHLEAGWRYTCTTPRNQHRIRLGCALPLLLGVDTLKLLGKANILDGGHRIKVPRTQVRLWLMRTVFWLPFPRRWENLFQRPEFSWKKV
jgi:farnesyl-diphosphate farnesyltransferase